MIEIAELKEEIAEQQLAVRSASMIIAQLSSFPVLSAEQRHSWNIWRRQLKKAKAGLEPLLEEQAAASAAPAGPAVSPWKVAWRPGAGRWTGLIDGAGGMR